MQGAVVAGLDRPAAAADLAGRLLDRASDTAALLAAGNVVEGALALGQVIGRSGDGLRAVAAFQEYEEAANSKAFGRRQRCWIRR